MGTDAATIISQALSFTWLIIVLVPLLLMEITQVVLSVRLLDRVYNRFLAFALLSITPLLLTLASALGIVTSTYRILDLFFAGCLAGFAILLILFYHPKPLLVIIDMQPFFTASRDRDTQFDILQLIRHWKDRGDPILVIEYEEVGQSTDFIREELWEYTNYHVYRKFRDDGSYVILYACRTHKLATREIHVCGVNANACVKRTTEGYAKRLRWSRVIVHARACYSESGARRVKYHLRNVTVLD